ncbi:MAG: M14 family zinc carboxypeptidase [Candidatus Zixiibacteriota bacterium]
MQVWRRLLKWALVTFVGLVVVLTTASTTRADETYIRLTVKSPAEIGKLTKLVSIDNVVADTVYAYANARQLTELGETGFTYQRLPHTSDGFVPRMADGKAPFAWDIYPTYELYVSMMQQYAQNYPTLCRLDTIGYSVQGRMLLMATISDNVNTEEDEPEVLYTSSMHGDELTGYVLMLRLIDSLLVGYGADAPTMDMVNGLKIYINPLANPDGAYYGGNSSVSLARRYNANGIDLNRNYPDPQDGQHPDGNAWQPETIAFMNFADSHYPVIAANFHGGAEVLNYPWDTWVTRHADDAWFQLICRQYADTCHIYAPSGYLTDLDNGITNGYDWYEVDGGRQDYMNYWHGCREITIELSSTKLLPAAQLPSYWEYNRRSFIQYLRQAFYGFRGLVTGSQTGLPLAATIRVLGHDVDNSEMFSDPTLGDYHRMIKAGTYTLEASAAGYLPDTMANIAITDGGTVLLDFQLDPIPSVPSLAFVAHSADMFEVGDTTSFGVTLVNNGGGAATSAVGTLTSSDGLVTILVDTSSFSPIPPLGGSAVSSSLFQFTVSPPAAPGRVIPFTLHVTADGGYADSVSFTALLGQRIETFESGTFTRFAWQAGGNQPWMISSVSPHEGIRAARSGVIGNSQTSQLLLTDADLMAGSISFWFRVSSEAGFDSLSFAIDGVSKGKWSGEVPWTQMSYPVTAGTHTFKWVYAKDISAASGSDAAWIDYVVLPYHDVQSCCVASTGNIDGDTGDIVDISDLSLMVDYLFFGGSISNCFEENDTDRSGSIDISDLSGLVDFLFFSGTLPACP